MSVEWFDRERERKYGDSLVTCKICGKRYARIGTHAVQFHHYEKAKDYYDEFGLTRKEGTSKEYAEVMRKKVFENGTVNNLKKGASKRFKKGDERIITKQWWSNRKKKSL